MQKKKIIILTVIFLSISFFAAHFSYANPNEAPHTEGFTQAYNQLKGFLDMILSMILAILKSLGDFVVHVMKKFADVLGAFFQYLRQWINSVFKRYETGIYSYTV